MKVKTNVKAGLTIDNSGTNSGSVVFGAIGGGMNNKVTVGP